MTPFTLSLVFFLVLNAQSSLQAPASQVSATPSSAEPSSSSQHRLVPKRTLIRTSGRPNFDTETLSELVNKRPGPTKSTAVRHYQALFAKHAKVQQLDKHTEPLDVNTLKERWTALRREEKGFYNAQKMGESIEYHLRDVVKVPEDAVEAVRYHWEAELEKEKGVRSRHRLKTALTPQHAVMYKARLKRQTAIHRETRARKRNGDMPWPFEDYMAVYNIPRNLSAKDLEVASRAFQHEYGRDTSAATKALKKHLEAKGYDSHQITLAIGERRTDRRKGQESRYKERKRSGLVGKPPSTKELQQEAASTAQVRDLTRKRKIQELLSNDKE